MTLAKKTLGQHWLTDKAALQAMCDAAEVNREDTVLEIGPGRGSLTRELIKRAKQVIAVELDQTLFEQLSTKRIAPNLQLVQGNILQFDLRQLPAGYKIVANIPYYLTGHLLRMLSESSHPPQLAAVLVQKEVAERVTARTGDMSLLSVVTQFYFEVSKEQVVPAKFFRPPPKVDSQILILKRRPQPLFAVDTRQFFQLVKAGFSSRRKTLLNALSAGLHLSKTEIEQILKMANLAFNLRAQALSLDDWQSLYKTIDKFRQN